MVNIKTKKILFLLHLPPPVHGSSMVGNFIAQSPLINAFYHTTYLNLLASKSVNETGKISIAKLWSFVFLFFKLIKKIHQQKPDLCYLALTTTGAAFYRDVVLVALLKVFQIPIVYHLHNKGIAKASQNKINKLLYNFVFKRAKVILLSSHLYADVEKFVKQTDVFICPNGIPDVSLSTPSITKKISLLPQILFLSNLIEAKGVWVLLKALQLLKQEGLTFTAVFIGGEGDITAKDFQKKVSELDLTDVVTYVGKKYGNEKQDYLQQAATFVLPTYYKNECFPLVLLEAMQYELPVVSTFEGGIPDLVDDGVTGFLVAQENVSQLAAKLKMLLLDADLREQMGRHGRKKYEEQFTLVQFEQNLIKILTSI